jgi:hypothetical protein
MVVSPASPNVPLPAVCAPAAPCASRWGTFEPAPDMTDGGAAEPSQGWQSLAVGIALLLGTRD